MKKMILEQCEKCRRIEVDDKWLLPLEAIMKGIEPSSVVKISECPSCKDDVTLEIITNAFPAIVQ